ncbi:hypothetical protein WJX72_001118 [[Myrmecia] bisecta]|uniref:Uncharacterized protein n=1 Tax=[Myrmecia] bisecta TaxID=41462 RepID=A0AAW1PJW7_9CHLO
MWGIHPQKGQSWLGYSGYSGWWGRVDQQGGRCLEMRSATLYFSKSSSALQQREKPIRFVAYDDLQQSINQLCQNEQWTRKELLVHGSGDEVLSAVHLPAGDPVLDLHVHEQSGMEGPAQHLQAMAQGIGQLNLNLGRQAETLKSIDQGGKDLLQQFKRIVTKQDTWKMSSVSESTAQEVINS